VEKNRGQQRRAAKPTITIIYPIRFLLICSDRVVNDKHIMSGINKVILVGHLGRTPELRYLENNDAVASFPLATSEYFLKNGVRTEQTEWHNIVMWRGLAEAAANNLHKGQLVYIKGKVATRKFINKDGIQAYSTEIIAERFTILGRRSDFENEPAMDTVHRDKEHRKKNNALPDINPSCFHSPHALTA